MTISYSGLTTPGGDIRVVFTCTSGSAAPAGAKWTVLLAGTLGTQSFSMPTANPAAASQVVSVTPSAGATGTSLPEGVYSVVIDYTDTSLGPTPRSTGTNTAVTIDRTTQTPTLAQPSFGYAVAAMTPFNVEYSLPEAALGGSVTLTLSGTSTLRVITFTSPNETAGAHSFSLDPANPEASPNVVDVFGGLTDAIPDGFYTATLAYNDTLANAGATATTGLVFFDTATSAPLLGQPASGATYPDTVPVSYTLPELGMTGSIELTFTGPVTRRVALANAGPGTHTLSLDPDDLAGSSGVSSAPDGNTLPDGTYSVQLQYQDSRSNPASNVTVSGVELGPYPVTTVTTTTTTSLVNTVTVPSTVTETTTETTTLPATTTERGPVTPTIAALAAEFDTKRTGRLRHVRATFAPRAGTARYGITARKGAQTRRGSCRRVKRTVACSVSVAPGAWSVTVAAKDADDATVAQANATLRVR